MAEEEIVDLAGYQVTKAELFAHSREPAITIWQNRMKFSMACLRRFPGTTHIQVLINPEEKRMIIRPCSPDTPDCLRWISKGGDNEAKTREMITVKKAPDGFVSDYILNHWKIGTEVMLSGPEGPFSYEPIRDETEILGLAGGNGITPFIAMANAILDGTEDFRLTLLYGSRKKEDILYADELEKICSVTDKVKVIHVLSEEQAEGYEHGFIGAELIQKYAPERYTLYICGPRAMHDFLAGELPKLGLDQKHIRREFVPAPGSPEYFENYNGDSSKVFTLSLQMLGEKKEIPLRADEPVLTAIERAGIAAPSRCRSGECGWCRSRLISGDVFIPESMDGRRLADDEAGYIHPCSTWAMSNLELEIFPE